jgi:hypothetical protein
MSSNLCSFTYFVTILFFYINNKKIHVNYFSFFWKKNLIKINNFFKLQKKIEIVNHILLCNLIFWYIFFFWKFTFDKHLLVIDNFFHENKK